MVSIIIPVYNEAKTIRQVIERVLALPFQKEIIVVDDCSYDGTIKILQNCRNQHVRCLFHGRNRGKGKALETGIEAAQGDIIVFQDADFEYRPSDISRVIEPIRNGSCEVCYGTRIPEGRFLSPAHKQVNKFLSYLTSPTLSDMETGMKAFHKKAIRAILPIESFGFEVEPEITLKLLAQGYMINEVPISYNARTTTEGKKINFIDGLKAVQTILWLRLRYGKKRAG